MCGITGIYSFNEIGRVFSINLQKSMNTLKKRGPDQRGTLVRERLCMGHTRLSIIDTSIKGKQPFSDKKGIHHLIFNGEIYNYRELRKELRNKGYVFESETDTEVLLYHIIENGIDGINDLNGFFAFALFNESSNELLLARDRYGIKPLYYTIDEDKFIFGSELSTVLSYQPDRNAINPMALQAYLQYNYIPAPLSIYKHIQKVLPGKWIKIKKGEKLQSASYYKLPVSESEENFEGSYEDAKRIIRSTLEKSVNRRLVADVPLGSFLSGGIDSSIITGLASETKKDLNTYSVGFSDDKYFDESKYAELVAKHYKTNHHLISISEKDLVDTLYSTVEYMSEPFADSSIIAYNTLCKKAGTDLKVALSGDGADELFGGYMKHQAWQMIEKGHWKVGLSRWLKPLLSSLPQSRKNSFGNSIRRIIKLGENAGLNSKDLYFNLCKISSEQKALEFIHADLNSEVHISADDFISSETGLIKSPKNLNETLSNDLKLVLNNDMLMKVDQASMANSLEVRVPFLDHELVNFVIGLPSDWKANSINRKQILVDSFKDMLPKEILERKKHGFEVPLQKWLCNELQSELKNTIFNRERIEEGRLLNWSAVSQLEKNLYSSNPGDSPARAWAMYLLVKKIN
ncbi:asparagine synthase (glutamine-hydrolyzing) [Hyphobacterium sp. CCMP332]|nr:asparagine synthase (glutamine-hydrolyzing) [Hyphobacterium sp. CCMP332]